MKPPEGEVLWPWVRFFLEEHLPVQRGVSPNTVASYRTGFSQFKRFLLGRMSRAAMNGFELSSFEPALLLEFLGWLEDPQGGLGVSATTRNVRAATMRSFARFLELYSSTQEETTRWFRLRHLPAKREMRRKADHLERRELERVFEAIPSTSPDGFRDLTLLAFLYNTGARASEVAGLRRADLRLDSRSPSARFMAKGQTVRGCPLWRITADLLERYLKDFRRRPSPAAEAFVFINQRGGRLTRSGVARRVQHYIGLAGQTTPSLRAKRLSVHSIRHTTAVHLIESGADIHVVKTWLGHRSTRSTDRYIDMELEPQRQLLERFVPPAALSTPASARADDAIWLEDL